MKYKFIIGESILLNILGSIVKAVVTGKTVFLGKPVYEVTFPNSGNTAVKLEETLTADTLNFIRQEEAPKETVETPTA